MTTPGIDRLEAEVVEASASGARFVVVRRDDVADVMARLAAAEAALRPFALVATEFDRLKKPPVRSIAKASQLGFVYGKARFGMPHFRAAAAYFDTATAPSCREE